MLCRKAASTNDRCGEWFVRAARLWWAMEKTSLQLANLLKDCSQRAARRMITFYFDGFRGLEQTFVPLLDVNFLMGENSTGKTSVLSAMQLISSQTFWITGEMRNEHIDFGAFQEIATIGRSQFHIGVLKEDEPNDPRFAALATFESRNQKPKLTSFRLLSEDQEVHITERASMRADKHAPTAEAVFRQWLENPSQVTAGAVSHGMKGRKRDGAIHPLRAWSLLATDDVWGLREWIWIAPIRAKPKRVYDAVGPDYSPEGDHTPYLLRRMLKSPDSPERRIFQMFGRDSGLFEDIHIREFGTDDLSPLSIDVDLGSVRTSIFNVGYGVSQALPILAEVIARSEGSTYSIQQPEVHLHPRAQATLGTLFFDMCRAPHRKKFLLETHSDFIIDRFRICMRKATDAGEPIPSAQVLFFERKGDKNVITPLVFESRGEYPEDQPAQFRDFFVQEELSNLGF